MPVEPVEVAVIGTGWCGGIRAETLSRYPLVKKLHVCEIRPDRLKEIKELTNAAVATPDYQDIVKNDAVKVVYISTTPENTHFPIARDCLQSRQACAAGKADRARTLRSRRADRDRQSATT